MKKNLKYGVFLDKKLYGLFRYGFDAKEYEFTLKKENPEYEVTCKQMR